MLPIPEVVLPWSETQSQQVRALLQSDDLSRVRRGLEVIAEVCVTAPAFFDALQATGAEPLPANWGPRGVLEDPMYAFKRVFAASSDPIKVYLSAWSWGFLRRLDSARVADRTTLNLEAAGLPAVPETIGELAPLQRLFLADNQLSAVPESIGRLDALRVLDLNDNHLQTLPRSIAGLRSLEEIWLEGNPLSEEELAQVRALLPARCLMSL